MLSKIRGVLEKSGADVILLRSMHHTTDPNFAYCSGLSSLYFHNNWLLLEKNKKPLVLISPLETISQKDKKGLRVATLSKPNSLQKILAKKLRNKKVGINFLFYPYSAVQGLKKTFRPKRIVDTTHLFETARETKTREEIRCIQTACKITEEALSKVPDIAKTGKTEEQISVELENLARKNGAGKTSFPTIVAFGKNGAIPHHQTGKTRIRNGNYLLVDFGIKVGNYCSDISRTFFVGKPSEEQEWNYWLVWLAQQKAFDVIKAGKQAKSAFEAADSVLKNGFGKPLPHALGHGLGIEEHDFPSRIGLKDKWEFAPNQVLALEPAVYFPGRFGVRIEDEILVEQEKARWLSKAPKELVPI